ncbi:STAS domain-containing protein [Nonomuraea rubra]
MPGTGSAGMLSDIAARAGWCGRGGASVGTAGAMTDLFIDVQHVQGCHVVRLDGEVDRTTQQPLAETFTGLLQADTPKIVVDVAGLTFCDSGGLWTLISSQRQAEERGGGLRLVGVRGTLARLLTITRLVHLFPPYSSLAEATTWAGSGGGPR